jgi:hypothetical protein
LLFAMILSGWTLGAGVCAVVFGKAVRSADKRSRRSWVLAESLHSPAAERGYVQPSLFDVAAMREAARPSREPVLVS